LIVTGSIGVFDGLENESKSKSPKPLLFSLTSLELEAKPPKSAKGSLYFFEKSIDLLDLVALFIPSLI
jgi:hypothetical protein